MLFLIQVSIRNKTKKRHKEIHRQADVLQQKFEIVGQEMPG